MSSRSPSVNPLTPASGTAAATSKLDEETRIFLQQNFELNFTTEDADDTIKRKLNIALTIVGNAIELAGDSDLEKRVRNKSEFRSYAARGSEKEQELTNLLKRMARKEVPWKDLFQNSTSLMSL